MNRSFNLRALFVVVLVLLASPFVLAESANEAGGATEAVKKESRELLEALKSYSSEQKAEAIKESRKVMDKLDAQIAALEKQLDEDLEKMSEAARREARANLEALRKRRLEVAEWYGQLKASSGSAWGHVKRGFSDAFSTLSDSLEEAQEELKEKNGNHKEP
ncbi:MAG: hypothetical protein OEX03_13505 [Gammaproteobacteria bacterium]|nr:hypothetical protein [Gammaproteobacteria bacterium]